VDVHCSLSTYSPVSTFVSSIDLTPYTTASVWTSYIDDPCEDVTQQADWLQWRKGDCQYLQWVFI